LVSTPRDRQRSTSAVEYRKLYKTAAWKAIRPIILARDLYTCQRCDTPLTQGRAKPTDAVVNHRKPHEGDWQLFTDPDNLEAVCKKCHDSAIQSQERGWRRQVGSDGWPTIEAPKAFGIPFKARASAIPVTLVFGRPAAGKTTYVQNNKKPGDIVIDLDDIKEEMFGSRYIADFAKVRRALSKRDRIIEGLATYTGRPDTRAWIVLTGSSPTERAAWRATLGAKADMVTITTSAAECKKRVMQCPERKPVAQSLIRVIDQWH